MKKVPKGFKKDGYCTQDHFNITGKALNVGDLKKLLAELEDTTPICQGFDNGIIVQVTHFLDKENCIVTLC